MTLQYHPYLKYEEINPDDNANLTFDNHIIKVPNASSDNETGLRISIKNTTLADNVDVTIKQSFSQDRTILHRLYMGGNSPSENINLLLLGDGFLTYPNFREAILKVVEVLTDNNILSPWNLIKDKLTIWAACEPTMNDKEGITMNFPVNKDGKYIPNYRGNGTTPTSGLNLSGLIDKIGLPDCNSPSNYNDAVNRWPNYNFTQSIYNDWLYFNTIKGYVENKDSVLGTRMGLRLGDNIESHLTSGEELPFNQWYRQSYDQREIFFDRRRYPLYTTGDREEDHCPYNPLRITFRQEALVSKSPFDIYLGSLKYGQEKIGETWQSFSKDADNVIIISNHYKDAAWNTSMSYQFNNPSFQHDVNWSFLTLFTEDDLKISLTTEEKLDDNANVASLYRRIDYVRLAGVLGHEYMHSIYIADGYERWTGSPGSSTNERPNLATKTHLLKPGTSKIDAKKIKWNLRRVALSSMVIGNVTMNNNILTVKLEVGQVKRWQKVLDNNLPLYIRSSRFQPNQDIIFYERSISKIAAIDSNSDTLKCTSSK